MKRERCKRAGAQIATMDQLEGLEPMHENWGDTAETGGEEGDGDPPRVWIPNQMSPGCAFTRSIGDQVGESVGVFAEVHMPPAGAPQGHVVAAPPWPRLPLSTSSLLTLFTPTQPTLTLLCSIFLHFILHSFYLLFRSNLDIIILTINFRMSSCSMYILYINR